MLKLLLAITFTVLVVTFSQDAGELVLWLPGLVIGCLGLAVGNRQHFSANDLFFILFLFLFVVAPADQIEGLRFQGDISVRGIVFPDHVLVRSVVLADVFGCCVLVVKLFFLMRTDPGSPWHRQLVRPCGARLLDASRVPRDASPGLSGDSNENSPLVIVDWSGEEQQPVSRRRQIGPHPYAGESRPSAPAGAKAWLLAFLVATDLCMLVGMIAATGGVSFILDGRNYTLRLVGDNPALAVVLQSFLQIVPLIGLIVGILHWQRRRTRSAVIWLVLLAALCLPFNNPLNTARFQFGAYGLMVALFVLRGRIPLVLCYIGLISYLVVIMPLMSSLRQGTSGFSNLDGNSFGLDFKQLDYDAFSMFTCAVYRTGDDGFTGGSYLLSVLLFFVPRSIWPDKPVASSIDLGQFLMQHHSGWFDNLSCPPFGDFYMDFGSFGVIACGLIYGVVLAWSDRVFDSWKGRSLFQCGVAAAVMGFLPILVRGSLGAVVGGFVVTVILFLVISRAMPRPTKITGV